MIYEMHHDLRGMLEALKFPQPWIYGPTPASLDGYHHGLIVMSRRRDGTGDAITGPVGVQRNPRTPRVRALAAEITIFARSNVEGAHTGNHERECEQVVDALIVAIREWGVEARAGEITPVEARYLQASERDDVETWPGVVYVLRFFVPRAVTRRDYTGAARPEGNVTGFTNRTDARRAGHPDSDPDVGCNSQGD